MGCTVAVQGRVSGRRRPSLQLALKLAQALELPPEEHEAWVAAARAGAASEEPASAAVPLPQPAPSPGLPVYLTPFIGREREQAELAELLMRPGCRLVTVLGQGGVGKTRLAIETARALADFADGVAFVSLAPLAAPESIVLAIGDALGFAFMGAGDPASQLLAHLRERNALLILDNLEHLLDPAGVTLGLLDRLLTQAPRVTVLATSRERLRLVGEWVIELVGLVVRETEPSRVPAVSPALALFAEHAERIDRAFRLTPRRRGRGTRRRPVQDSLPLACVSSSVDEAENPASLLLG